MTRRLTIGAVAAITALALAGCSSGDDGSAQGGDAPTAAVDDPALTALIEDAQAEGSLTLYGIPDERALRELAAAFTEKYDIDVTVLRLVSADLSQRFSAEAAAGATVADAILLTYSPFYDEAFGEGWLTPLDEAEIPGFPDDFPADYLAADGDTAVVSMVPTEMVYNTDLVDPAPDDWEAYAEPEFKDQLLFAEPASSPANLSFWSLMLDEYGEDYLKAIADNNPTWMNSAVNTTQGVAAGEGSLAHPGVLAIVKTLQEQGAPVKTVSLSPTTGPEIALGLSADAPNPNAARLFSHFVLSEEGNTVLAEETGAGSPYGVNLVDGYVRPGPVPEETREKILSLFGF
ncbi:extracellular solute-binding protein [Agromyces sp. NPDC049794]|uniref:ABC transporter substrate-binding protein n=1 Tax=unclassified Agromyces TaxID=2639701 RepID=UPI0033E858DC